MLHDRKTVTQCNSIFNVLKQLAQRSHWGILHDKPRVWTILALTKVHDQPRMLSQSLERLCLSFHISNPDL